MSCGVSFPPVRTRSSVSIIIWLESSVICAADRPLAYGAAGSGSWNSVT